ncbi:MAG TPA: Holliday junction branch migration DNA helicase RuvB [Armatimonadota bacterium]|nr:Holliday junction branch migration DNA helicase RuvB [Armatimonadota bacterium]
MDDQPQRIIGPEKQVEDVVQSFDHRPQTLDEYDVGQRRLIDGLKISIAAAQKRGEPLEHLLFDGPPGLGKTTLAYIIANEMGVKLHQTSGPALERAADLVGILTNMEAGQVLFVDEIHRLPSVVEEFLYPAMESFRVDFVLDRGAYARTVTVPVKRFTLVGATTRAGLLTAPLRERFGIYHHLDFYSVEQLQRIVHRSADQLEVEINPKGAHEIAARSRGTARVANRLLRRVRDYAEVEGDGRIAQEIAAEALRSLGVDHLGLDEQDRRYLAAIIGVYRGGPAGVNAVAATLNVEQDTLEDVVEPFLLKIGLIRRTPRGREATAEAYEHLGLPPGRPSEGDHPTFEF